mgnify:CR=1 FL=1
MILLLGLSAIAGRDPLIQDHLFEVAASLRAETPDSLPADVRARRLDALDLLDDYAAGGEFPVHRVARPVRPRPVRPPRAFDPGDRPRTPVFVDGTGLHCAVGYLMGVGEPALVASIVADANEAYVHELDRPDVRAWADRHGFTLDELAWIQPGYDPYMPTCAEPLTDGHGYDLSEQADRACGPVDVRAGYADGCEVCGQGFSIAAVLSNYSPEPQTVDLVIGGASDVAVARREAIELAPWYSRTVVVEGLDWQEVRTVRVEAEGNCSTDDVDHVWPATEPGKQAARCPGTSCATAASPASALALLVGLVSLLRRRRVG